MWSKLHTSILSTNIFSALSVQTVFTIGRMQCTLCQLSSAKHFYASIPFLDSYCQQCYDMLALVNMSLHQHPLARKHAPSNQALTLWCEFGLCVINCHLYCWTFFSNSRVVRIFKRCKYSKNAAASVGRCTSSNCKTAVCDLRPNYPDKYTTQQVTYTRTTKCMHTFLDGSRGMCREWIKDRKSGRQKVLSCTKWEKAGGLGRGQGMKSLVAMTEMDHL